MMYKKKKKNKYIYLVFKPEIVTPYILAQSEQKQEEFNILPNNYDSRQY